VSARTTSTAASSTPAPARVAADAATTTTVATGAADAAATPPQKPPPPALGSYDVGLVLGGQLEHSGLGPVLSLDELIRGLKESLGGRVATAEEREAATLFMRSARDALAEHNRSIGHAFLEKNAKADGIVTMPSGLQYRVLAAGDPNGKSPTLTDQVTVRYRASLLDGTEYDRSETHDRPATFRVNSVFKGWQEAFLAMKPGAKWQLFVPPELGYGANSPPAVPPGSLLIYELELLRVEGPPTMDPEAAAKRRPAAGPKSDAATPAH